MKGFHSYVFLGRFVQGSKSKSKNIEIGPISIFPCQSISDGTTSFMKPTKSKIGCSTLRRYVCCVFSIAVAHRWYAPPWGGAPLHHRVTLVVAPSRKVTMSTCTKLCGCDQGRKNGKQQWKDTCDRSVIRKGTQKLSFLLVYSLTFERSNGADEAFIWQQEIKSRRSAMDVLIGFFARPLCSTAKRQ